MTRRRPARALAAVAGCVLLAGCGGSGAPAAVEPVSPTRYVTALCGAIAPFEQDVARRSGALSGAGAASPAAGKRELGAYLSALAADSHRAVAELSTAGQPQVTGGRRFAEDILTTFRRLDRALTRSVGLAQELPTVNATAFRASAGTLATAVRQSVADLGSGLSTQTNTGLDKVAAKVPACHAL